MGTEATLILILLLHLFRHYLGPQFIYFLFYQCWNKSAQTLKIQNKYPSKKQITRERNWTKKSQYVDIFVIAIAIYLYNSGLTKLSIDKSDSFLSFLAIILLLTFAQDLYFYISHRILHTSYLYRKVHLIHHHSRVTTPFTSFCVHPIEKLIELLFFPIVIILIPMSTTTLLIFIFLSTLINLFGHAGFELKWIFFKKADPLAATSVFHEMHHIYPKTNFSLYLVIWDKIFHTIHPRYRHFYEREGV